LEKFHPHGWGVKYVITTHLADFVMGGNGDFMGVFWGGRPPLLAIFVGVLVGVFCGGIFWG